MSSASIPELAACAAGLAFRTMLMWGGFFVGRLTRDKGVPELIEAFDAILAAKPNAHLLLVGWFDASEDALSRSLRARIESHPRIHLTGYVADTAPYYRVMDVMVLPTWSLRIRCNNHD